MAKFRGTHALGIVTALGLGACGVGDDSYDRELVFRDDGGNGCDARSGRPCGGDGGWLSNGLQSALLSGVNPDYGLDADGLAETYGLLTDPEHHGVAEYIVECALPATASIAKTVNGQPETLHGLLGLAPEWESGACNVDCQQWVSACLLARTNVTGQDVSLWVQSDHPAIGYGLPPTEPVLEAAWYGNLFAPTPEMYLCTGELSEIVESVRASRTCTQGACGFTSFGGCGESRCTLVETNDEETVPINCVNEAGTAFHTLSTYLPED